MELRDEDFDNVNPGEPRFLIPQEGGYPAQFIGSEIKRYGRWGEKLIFKWKVFTSQGIDNFVILWRYYNLERDNGGRMKFGPLHAYRKDWVAANGDKHPLNRSRLPLSIFQERLFFVEVETVRHDSKGRPLSASFHWSKIGRVIRPLAENECCEGLSVQRHDS